MRNNALNRTTFGKVVLNPPQKSLQKATARAAVPNLLEVLEEKFRVMSDIKGLVNPGARGAAGGLQLQCGSGLREAGRAPGRPEPLRPQDIQAK